MTESRHRLRWLAPALTILILSLTTAAQDPSPREFAPVQKGFTSQGEMTIPYATDRLLVQFRDVPPDVLALGIPWDKGAQLPGARTGLTSIDDIA